MIDLQPLEVVDFSGGITDYFIDGAPNKAEKMDNFFYTNHKKLGTRWGSEVFLNAQLPSGQFKVNLIHFLRDSNTIQDSLLAFTNNQLMRELAGSYSAVVGPGGGFFTEGNADSKVSVAEYQDILFAANDSFSSIQKIYFDENSVMQARNAGLPELPAAVTVTDPAGTGSTYSYAFLFRYSFQVGDKLFLDRGPVQFFPTIVQGGTITSGNGATITIPTTFPTPENWDVSNFEVEIYRTQNGDADYFLVGSVPFGTSTFVDEVEDSVIPGQGSLYGENGTISNGTPPKAKYVHVVNNVGYYAHTKEGTLINKFAIYQSIPGDPDSVPPGFIEETEQEITGLSSIFDRPIVLCRNYIYRIDQFIASDGTGLMDLRRIDDRAGCVSENSIVQTHKGLFWAGEVGFYWSDGFKVLKISDAFNETYQRLVSTTERAENIHGTYDPNNERVIWTVSSDESSTEADSCYVVDLRFGIKSDAAFTTMSGGDSFKPTTMKFHKDPQTREIRIYRGDTRGYVFYHQEGLRNDPKVSDSNADPNTWIEQAIIFDYKSCALDFGSKFARKFVPRMLVSAENQTNLSLAISSSNDDGRVVGDLKPIRYKQNITWGSSLPLWGDPASSWNLQGIIEEWRRFPAKGLRCQYKQIEFTNAPAQILTSDLLGQVTIDPTLKTATLTGSLEFPTRVEDYFLKLETDGFVRRFRILDRAPNTLVLEDNDNLLPILGTYNFVMEGIPKGETLTLNGYVIHWAYLSKTHTPFISGSLGSTPT